MKKRQRKKKNIQAGIKVFGKPEYLGEVDIPTTVDLIQYNENEYSKTVLHLNNNFDKHLKNDCINWFKVTGLSDADYINGICKNFGLHNFDVRELLSDAKVVKFALYDKVTFALISGYYFNNDNEVEDMQLAFILGDNFVISFKESPIPVFKEVEKAIVENNIVLRQKGADFLLYILLSTVNSFNNDFIIQSEDNLINIEERLISGEDTIDVLHILRSQRKIHIQLKRFMSSLREEYENMLDNSNQKVKKANIVYFENLDDKYRTTASNIESYEESIKSLLDLFYNNNSMKMSEIMKRLTIVATIFIPLTFLVGVWGMNFVNMPELTWEYGYIAAWIVFAVVAIAGVWMMKKKKWF